MTAVFYLVCALSLVFFLVFFAGCSAAKPVRHQGPTVRKLPLAEAVDSPVGRRFLVNLEKEMAQFLSSHSHTTCLLLLAALLAVPAIAHAQQTEYNHRTANVPYFSGPVTPQGGSTGCLVVAGWAPDLVKSENRMPGALLVMF